MDKKLGHIYIWGECEYTLELAYKKDNKQTQYGQIHDNNHKPKDNIIDCWYLTDSSLVYYPLE